MEPEPDWYFDNVIVASGPERAPVGQARRHQAAWLARAAALREGDPSIRPLIELALRQGLVVTTSDLRDHGLPRAVSRRLIRQGRWAAPRRGVVSLLPPVAAGPSGTGPEIRAAAAALVWTGAAVSHGSAAAMHGLPVLTPPGPPTLTVPRGFRAFSYQDIRVHVAAITHEDLDDWFGAAVTNLARTIVDIARARGLRDGLVAADAALHERLVSHFELDRAVERQRGWPGVRTARRTVELADGRAESPLESLSRLCFARGGLPAPELQAWIDTVGGRYRVDFLWPASRVIVEVDGMIKYRDWRALADEKRRHEFLERAGYRVIRLMWDDIVRHPAATVARIRAALVR